MKAGKLHIMPPYLAFISLDGKSVRFTIPLCTVRRVERLNARAGVYALSLLLWHGMKIVCIHLHHSHLSVIYRASFKGGTIDFTPPSGGSVLWSPQSGAQGGAKSRKDEVREAVLQDVLL